MKNNILVYKGYHTKIEFDLETYTLRGKIEGIGDLVNFSSQDITTIEQEFHNAVDDYLEFCEEVGKEPDKEYKGTFNVRIAPELHKQLALEAYKEEESLNALVEKAINEYLNKDSNAVVREKTIYILPSDFAQKTQQPKKPFVIDNAFSFEQNPIGSNITMFYRNEAEGRERLNS